MKKLSRRQTIILSSGFAILIPLMLFVLSKDWTVSANRNVSTSKTPDVANPYTDSISNIKTDVAISPNEGARAIEEDRLQTLEREATFVAEGKTHQSDPVTPVPTQFIQSTLQVIEDNPQQQWGLIENPSVPMSGMVFHGENAWKQDMGDGYVLIIAGYSPKNPDQGLLFVDISRNNLFTSRTFKAPGNGGSIHIEKAVGMRLVLKTANGDVLYFDIPGLRFANSL